MSEATVVSLSARTDVGRCAVIVANTRCRTGDIAKAYFQLMSTLRVSTDKDNKTLPEKEFFSQHFADTLKVQFLNNANSTLAASTR